MPYALCLGLALVVQTSPSDPVILIQPYLQPGHEAALRTEDSKTLRWYTDLKPAAFAVRFGEEGATPRIALPERSRIQWPGFDAFQYTASLEDLPLNAVIRYRVVQEPRGPSTNVLTVREGSFATRRSPDRAVRFFVAGDLADGKPTSRRIADQIARVKPEFGLLTGDIVYSNGTLTEYLDHFWPVYNQPASTGPQDGAPLMKSVVFYPVVGNHDLSGFDFHRYPDGMAAFLFFDVPRNGPRFLPQHFLAADAATWKIHVEKSVLRGFPPIQGPTGRLADFRESVGTMFPGLCNYSFENGPLHALCLDMSGYVNVDDPTLNDWIRADLLSSSAPWKLVFFHQPGFNQSKSHWAEQRARRLAPLFESCGVAMVFSGHVHNYQRSHPLRFKPSQIQTNGEVPGTFQLDNRFDGRRRTRADGVIYIVSGGAGASLYDKDFTGHPKAWKRGASEPENYMARFVSDRHTFSLLDVGPDRLTLRQIDDRGAEVDHLEVTRGASP